MYRYLGSTDIFLYDFIGTSAFVFLLFFNIFHYKKKRNILSFCSTSAMNVFSKKHQKPITKVFSNATFWAIIETILISIVQYAFALNLNQGFGDMVRTGSNYYGLLFFSPVLMFALCLAIWLDPLKQIDLITPSFPFALVFSRIACFCNGCCGGIEWSSGLYNYYTNRVEFPLQLLEAGLALLIFIFLMFWRNKAKPGTMFPTYLIIYSASRFFIEFLSNKENVFGIFKRYHVICAVGVVVGIIELVIVLKFGKDISDLFSESHYFIPNKTKKKNKKKKTESNA